MDLRKFLLILGLTRLPEVFSEVVATNATYNNEPYPYKQLAATARKGKSSIGFGSDTRNWRYLFPFAFVNFPPEPCSPTNQQTMDGVCLSRKRCTASNGMAVGQCQNNLGTCCKFTKTCTANTRSVTVTEAVENLASPGSTGSCEFTFPKQQGICQIRLDFGGTKLQDPYTSGPNAGNCQGESITVMGASNLKSPLKVCGSLSGQHMILSYGATSDLISVVAYSETANAMNLNIRATQVPCTSLSRAPDDCLQYFTASTGAVKSFGFGKQLNSQNYMICINPTSGGSTLSWDKCNDADADSVAIADRFHVSDQSTVCNADYIAIDAEKRCGHDFLPLVTMDGSSRIRVHFDENEQGEDRFTFPVPTTEMNPRMYCEALKFTNAYVALPIPDRSLCSEIMVNALPVCECTMSNAPDKLALPLQLELVKANNRCPIIKGFMANPEMADGTTGNCKYYANVRTTDRDNTGFCLRYQSM